MVRNVTLPLGIVVLHALLVGQATAAEPAVDSPIGSDLSAWREDSRGDWMVAGDASMDPRNEKLLASRPGTGTIVNGKTGITKDLLTSKDYADVEAHVEFMVPRGSNSGVYFMGRYEIQVFDSFGNEKLKHGDCGGIYERWDETRGPGKEGFEGHPPRVNASRKPGEWQSFDVVFKAPRFDASGNRASRAKFVKVVHNGVTIHEDVEVGGPTRAAHFGDEKPVGPLMLQGDHGPVAYRNIKIRPVNLDAAPFVREKLDDSGFVAIFDGKSLAGWHVSPKTPHSRTSGSKTGGKWVVEDGAIVGCQDIPGNGGIIITDKQFGDFEVVLEMKNDFAPDSGLFLRSTEEGSAYQYLVDYYRGGNVAGLYGENMPRSFTVRNYSFLEDPSRIKEMDAPYPLPVKPADWPKLWKHGEWNELRARIVGNPPKITTWINGVRFMEHEDKEKRLGDTGGIALQVHGGGDLTKQFVRYRNIRVKELKAPPK